jgi:hypothetical protein
MANSLRPCPNCSRQMDASRKTCVFCQQAGIMHPPVQTPVAPEKAATPPPPSQPGILHRPIGGSLSAIIFAIILMIRFFGGGGIPGLPSTHRFEVRVSTSPSSGFTGSYGGIGGDGSSTSHSV